MKPQIFFCRPVTLFLTFYVCACTKSTADKWSSISYRWSGKNYNVSSNINDNISSSSCRKKSEDFWVCSEPGSDIAAQLDVDDVGHARIAAGTKCSYLSFSPEDARKKFDGKPGVLIAFKKCFSSENTSAWKISMLMPLVGSSYKLNQGVCEQLATSTLLSENQIASSQKCTCVNFKSNKEEGSIFSPTRERWVGQNCITRYSQSPSNLISPTPMTTCTDNYRTEGGERTSLHWSSMRIIAVCGK